MKKKAIVVAVLLAITLASCAVRGGGCPAVGTIPCNTPPKAPSDTSVNLPHKR
jgi:hypothetical protein